jgi:hypothetical protein
MWNVHKIENNICLKYTKNYKDFLQQILTIILIIFGNKCYNILVRG